jgi:hypothetical protein
MGITIYSRPKSVRRRFNRHVHKRAYYQFQLKSPVGSKYNYKRRLHKKSSYSIDVVDLLEDKLYHLNTEIMHLKLYIKQMMYQYVGDTRQEIAVFYAMAVNLYKNCSGDYYDVMNYKKKILEIDITKYQEEYEGILDLCGTTSNEVYEHLFDCNDDGYETPREYPADLCADEPTKKKPENPDGLPEDDDELLAYAINLISTKLSI